MKDKFSFGTKKLGSAGNSSKAIIIPKKWRKSIGDPKYYEVESSNGMLIIRPHKE